MKTLVEVTSLYQLTLLLVPCRAQPRHLVIRTKQIKTAYPRANITEHYHNAKRKVDDRLYVWHHPWSSCEVVLCNHWQLRLVEKMAWWSGDGNYIKVLPYASACSSKINLQSINIV